MSVVLIILGIACILYGVSIMSLWSGTMFFVVWYILGALCFGAAWLLGSGTWEELPLLFKRAAEIVCALAMCVLLVCCGLIATAFTSQGEKNLDYIIVLGAQVRPDGPSIVLQHRLDTAYDYLVANPNTRCIVSGGQGPNEPTTEAEAMAAYLINRGIPENRIIREDASTNTVENITNSMAYFDPQVDRVGIITNNFHVFRSTRIANHYGINHACGIAAPSHPFYLPNNVLRECLGIMKDAVFGNL